MTRMINSHSASSFSIDLSVKRRAAAFHFVETTGDVRVVTVPLGALGRLYRDIQERLRLEPQLFEILTADKRYEG